MANVDDANYPRKSRVVMNTNVLTGNAIISGIHIFDCLVIGWTMSEVIENHPNVTQEDELTALTSAAVVMRQKPLITIEERGQS